MKLRILLPNKTVKNDRVKAVTLPALEGQITVLENHSACMTSLVQGLVVVEAEDMRYNYAVLSGLAMISGSSIDLYTSGTTLLSPELLQDLSQKLQRASHQEKLWQSCEIKRKFWGEKIKLLQICAEYLNHKVEVNRQG